MNVGRGRLQEETNMQNIPKFDAATRLATSPTRRIVAGQLLTMLTVAFLPSAVAGHVTSH